mmetsp:Transcript_29044/g.94670  ORF Transcript_29044/g.94670 Transcript_29044/m.94670 type:complete len:287 (-) Transcript_29044:619-1479(-)
MPIRRVIFLRPSPCPCRHAQLTSRQQRGQVSHPDLWQLSQAPCGAHAVRHRQRAVADGRHAHLGQRASQAGREKQASAHRRHQRRQLLLAKRDHGVQRGASEAGQAGRAVREQATSQPGEANRVRRECILVRSRTVVAIPTSTNVIPRRGRRGRLGRLGRRSRLGRLGLAHHWRRPRPQQLSHQVRRMGLENGLDGRQPERRGRDLQQTKRCSALAQSTLTGACVRGGDRQHPRGEHRWRRHRGQKCVHRTSQRGDCEPGHPHLLLRAPCACLLRRRHELGPAGRA